MLAHFQVQEAEMPKKLEIQTWDTERRRFLERQGYVIERGTPQTLVMRLDFPKGIQNPPLCGR
jgi:hypothetical protein